MVFQDTTAAAPSASPSSSAAASSTPAPIAASSTQVAAPATSSAAPASGFPDVNGYAYYGCIKEIDTRILTNDHLVSDPMTLETCAAFCSSYPFFGLEYTHECTILFPSFVKSTGTDVIKQVIVVISSKPHLLLFLTRNVTTPVLVIPTRCAVALCCYPSTPTPQFRWFLQLSPQVAPFKQLLLLQPASYRHLLRSLLSHRLRLPKLLALQQFPARARILVQL
jgi:hypothetical protein